MILSCALTFRCDFSYHSVRGGQGCQYLTLTVELLVKFYSGQTTCKENIVHQVKVRKKKRSQVYLLREERAGHRCQPVV